MTDPGQSGLGFKGWFMDLRFALSQRLTVKAIPLIYRTIRGSIDAS